MLRITSMHHHAWLLLNVFDLRLFEFMDANLWIQRAHCIASGNIIVLSAMCMRERGASDGGRFRSGDQASQRR
jgi:hypothetical protein